MTYVLFLLILPSHHKCCIASLNLKYMFAATIQVILEERAEALSVRAKLPKPLTLQLYTSIPGLMCFATFQVRCWAR